MRSHNHGGRRPNAGRDNERTRRYKRVIENGLALLPGQPHMARACLRIGLADPAAEPTTGELRRIVLAEARAHRASTLPPAA